MRKLYTLLGAALLIGSSAFAQKKVNVKFQIVTPANGATITAGATLTQKIIITNLGPGAIAPTDTVFVHDPFNQPSRIWLYLGFTKAVGDTIQLSKDYVPSTSNPNGVRNYCVYGYVSNGTLTTNDSVAVSANPSIVCNSTTFVGGGVGVPTLQLTEQSLTENISVFPNPATGMISLSFTAKNASEVSARVIDITGREALSVNLGKAYVGQSGYKLDISSLNTGVYFVELRQEGIRAIGRVTKQ